MGANYVALTDQAPHRWVQVLDDHVHADDVFIHLSIITRTIESDFATSILNTVIAWVIIFCGRPIT